MEFGFQYIILCSCVHKSYADPSVSTLLASPNATQYPRSPGINGNPRGGPSGTYGAVTDAIQEAPTKHPSQHQRVTSVNNAGHRSISFAENNGNAGAGRDGEAQPLISSRGGASASRGGHEASDAEEVGSGLATGSSWMPRLFK